MFRTAFLTLCLLTSFAFAAEPQGIAVGEPHPSPGTPDPALLRYLGINGNGAGRWSADGSQIAFSTAWTGTTQKWVIPSGGGFPRRITYFEDTVEFCDFSPHDPNLMWLGVASGGNERTQLWFVNADGSNLRPLAVDDRYIHNPGDWSRDGRYISYTSNERDERYFDVYVYDTQIGTSKRVFQRDENMSSGKFSPDGKFLIVTVNHSNVNNDVYLINPVGENQTEGLLLTPHDGEAQFGSFTWGRFQPDPTQAEEDSYELYCVTNMGREFAGIARTSLDAIGTSALLYGDYIKYSEPPKDGPSLDQSDWKFIYSPERDVESLNISDDSKWIGWVENEDGFGKAYLIALRGLADLAQGELKDLLANYYGLPVPKGIQAVGRFSPDSKSVILQSNGPENTTDLWLYEIETGKSDRLTYASLGGIPADTYVVPEVQHFASFDGVPISGLWYVPRGEKPAAGWPVVMVAHGGPEGQARPYFDPQVQLYLSLGAAVFELNPRGSSGYGKTYMTLDNVAKREDSVHDYAFARDWLVAQRFADPARVAISGGSYGGYVVLGALTLYPDKWAAGVDNVGISNFVTFLENTGPYRRAIREAEYGSLATDHDVLERISPLHRVENITAPLLIIHGTNDPRVPVNEAQQMHDALHALGREVDLLVFADEGHGVAKLSNRAIAWQRELEFLKKHLGL